MVKRVLIRTFSMAQLGVLKVSWKASMKMQRQYSDLSRGMRGMARWERYFVRESEIVETVVDEKSIVVAIVKRKAES